MYTYDLKDEASYGSGRKGDQLGPHMSPGNR